MIFLICKKCGKPQLRLKAKSKDFICSNCGEIKLYEVDFAYIEDKPVETKSTVCSLSADGGMVCS